MAVAPRRGQRSLEHLPAWVCWEYCRRELARRASLQITAPVTAPGWRRWSASPIHGQIARAWRDASKVTDLERDLLRVVAVSDDVDVVARAMPAFLSWVRGESVECHDASYRSAIALQAGRARVVEAAAEPVELERIAEAVQWPSAAE